MEQAQGDGERAAPAGRLVDQLMAVVVVAAAAKQGKTVAGGVSARLQAAQLAQLPHHSIIGLGLTVRV